MVTITVNAKQAQIRANDSNRVASMRQYQAALELHRSTNRTYWVARMAGIGRDQLAGLVTKNISDQNRLTASNADRVAYKDQLVGYKGGGWGRMNAKGTLGNYGQTYSIADALVYEGVLSQVRFDPRMTDPQVVTGDATHLELFNDFNLTLCDVTGAIPANPLDATNYGLFVQLEQPNRYPESNQVDTFCGGANVGGGWDTITTD